MITPTCPTCQCPMDGHVDGACMAVVAVTLDRYERCLCGHTQPALPDTEEEA